MRIREGFIGQRMWVIPRPSLESCAAQPMLQSLLPKDIGWFPAARYHYRERAYGADEHILIFCISGSGWYEIAGRQGQVKAREALLIPRGTPHAYYADESDPWSIHWVHFVGMDADLMLSQLPVGENVILTDRHSAEAIERLFVECYESFAGGFIVHRLIYCAQVLHHLLGRLFFNNACYSPLQRTRHLRTLEPTLTFLHQNIHRKLTLREIAEHAGLSVSYVSSLFKQQTGMSPMDYLIHLKMQHACALLSLQQKGVHEVAYEIGYTDPYYFSRIFKKVIGASPLHYRENRSAARASETL